MDLGLKIWFIDLVGSVRRVGWLGGICGRERVVSGEGMGSEGGEDEEQLGDESGGSGKEGLGVDDVQIMSCKELEDKDREGEKLLEGLVTMT